MSTFGDTTQTQDPYADTTQTQNENPTRPVGRPPLRRAYDGRILAGVCAGIADYLAVDVTIVRVAFAVFTFLGGAGVPAYLACLLLIPEEGTDQSIASSLLDGIR
jgi:phage shock protein C